MQGWAPATRAAIIETLLTREYVVRDKKALVATPKGLALVRTLNSPLLTSAELTGQWEQKLARMARNAYACETFMGEVRGMVDTLVAQIARSALEPPTPGGDLPKTAALRPAGSSTARSAWRRRGGSSLSAGAAEQPRLLSRQRPLQLPHR